MGPRYRGALGRLAESQKTNKGAPAYSRFVNRPFGRILAAGAFVVGLTPNQVTAMSAVFTFAGLALAAFGHLWWGSAIACMILLMIGYALDAADGQLARLRGGGSAAGEWLDHVVDAVKAAFLHISILLCWWLNYSIDIRLMLVPILYSAVSTIFFFAMILTDQLRRQHLGTTSMIMKGQGKSSILYSIAVTPTDYGFMILMFGLIWLQSTFVPIYVLLLVANAVFLCLALPKWFMELRSLTK
ncbi:hypothetical protein AS189_16530 [Arthrobacter alpinus]|uniref:CDP-alcohol phosphatidyltransferase n=1 Tax=Arthrobacter alpinus TaxID=656366 RepID=A0A0S2M4H2_9MICC|nr:hypothetical protein AS189_16530 [Arthrobacter alpinus]